MKLRTENPQLAAYVVTKGGLLNDVRVAETADGVTVVFELDIIGFCSQQLRQEFYACRWRVSMTEYSYQVGQMTERMFRAVPYVPVELHLLAREQRAS